MSMAYIKEQQVDFLEATQFYQRVIDNPNHLGYPVTCDAYLGLTRVLIKKNKLKAAADYLVHGKELARQIDVSDRLEICDLLHIEIEILTADYQDIQFLIEQVSSQIRLSKKNHLMAAVDELQFRFFLKNQRIEALKSISSFTSNTLIKGYYELLNKDVKAAVHHLDEADSLTMYEAIEIQLLKAYVLYLQHKRKEAYSLLENILLECMHTSYIQILIQVNIYFDGWLEDQVEDLLFLIRYPSFKSLLIDSFKTSSSKNAKSRLENALLIEALTPRELEVLNLIGKGFSNEEICKKLFVAISTVKGTNQRIFAKLHVKRRTEAVLRAQSLGILSSKSRSMSI
jgi:LuxR family maltose regulon positive regulatory protein